MLPDRRAVPASLRLSESMQGSGLAGSACCPCWRVAASRAHPRAASCRCVSAPATCCSPSPTARPCSQTGPASKRLSVGAGTSKVGRQERQCPDGQATKCILRREVSGARNLMLTGTWTCEALGCPPPHPLAAAACWSWLLCGHFLRRHPPAPPALRRGSRRPAGCCRALPHPAPGCCCPRLVGRRRTPGKVRAASSRRSAAALLRPLPAVPPWRCLRQLLGPRRQVSAPVSRGKYCCTAILLTCHGVPLTCLVGSLLGALLHQPSALLGSVGYRCACAPWAARRASHPPFKVYPRMCSPLTVTARRRRIGASHRAYTAC